MNGRAAGMEHRPRHDPRRTKKVAAIRNSGHRKILFRISVTIALMTNSKAYVRSDENGALRVGKTKVSLDSVVYAFKQGHSPETIQQQYPSLSLEEIYGAITYYLGNREEVDGYLKRQEQLWDQLRQQSEQAHNPVVQRLRALRANKAVKDQ
jgi:uncharacterized protein (DUF433 family)